MAGLTIPIIPDLTDLKNKLKGVQSTESIKIPVDTLYEDALAAIKKINAGLGNTPGSGKYTAIKNELGGMSNAAGLASTKLKELGGTGMDGLLKHILEVTVALEGARQVADIFKEAFNLNASMTAGNLAFTQLIGNQKVSADLMKQINQLAVDTPLTDKQVVTNAQRLVAAGEDYKEVLKTIKAVGNIEFTFNAADANQKINDASIAISQILTKGNLMGDEARQLKNAGIDIYTYLGKAFDKLPSTMRDLSDQGKVSAMDAIRAIELYGTTTLKNGMENATKTLPGAFEQMKSNMVQALSSGTQAISDDLVQKLNSVTKALQVSDKDGSLGVLIKSIKDSMEALIQVITGGKGNISDLSDIFLTLASALETGANFLKDHAETINKLIQVYIYYKAAMFALSPAISLIVGALGLLSSITLITGASVGALGARLLAFATNPVTIAVAAAIALAGSLVYCVAKYKDGTIAVKIWAESLVYYLAELYEKVYQFIDSTVGKIPAVGKVLENIIFPLGKTIDVLTDGGKKLDEFKKGIDAMSDSAEKTDLFSGKGLFGDYSSTIKDLQKQFSSNMDKMKASSDDVTNSIGKQEKVAMTYEQQQQEISKLKQKQLDDINSKENAVLNPLKDQIEVIKEQRNAIKDKYDAQLASLDLVDKEAELTLKQKENAEDLAKLKKDLYSYSTSTTDEGQAEYKKLQREYEDKLLDQQKNSTASVKLQKDKEDSSLQVKEEALERSQSTLSASYDKTKRDIEQGYSTILNTLTALNDSQAKKNSELLKSAQDAINTTASTIPYITDSIKKSLDDIVGVEAQLRIEKKNADAALLRNSPTSYTSSSYPDSRTMAEKTAERQGKSTTNNVTVNVANAAIDKYGLSSLLGNVLSDSNPLLYG